MYKSKQILAEKRGNKNIYLDLKTFEKIVVNTSWQSRLMLSYTIAMRKM